MVNSILYIWCIINKPELRTSNLSGTYDNIVVVYMLQRKYQLLACPLEELFFFMTLDSSMLRNMYLNVHWVSWPNVRSSGGNTSSSAEVLSVLLLLGINMESGLWHKCCINSKIHWKFSRFTDRTNLRRSTKTLYKCLVSNIVSACF